ncbi:MAG: hypothetical protein ABWY77_00145 [Acidimicrobiia bacterium]
MVLVMIALSGAVIGRGADAGSSPSLAAKLVERVRAATEQTNFTGVVTVSWRTAGGARQHASVDVRAANGVVEASSDDHLVLDDGGHTFLKDDLGWSSPVSEPAAKDRPAPDARWRLSVQAGTLDGREVSTVVAKRANGSVAMRLVVDDDTSLPLARQVLDPHGKVLRAYAFESLDVQPAGTAAAAAAVPNTSTRTATAVRDVPSGYHAPARAGAGYTLLSRSRHDDGLHLVYSDGLFTVSITEQRGELDWDSMPSGAVATDVDGVHARRYSEASGDVLVWERDGVVYTCVSDAPTDVLAAMVAGLTPDRSLPTQVADFVLGPFGFD